MSNDIEATSALPENALNELLFPAGVLTALRRTLLDGAPLESAAFVLARAVERPSGGWRLLAYETIGIAPHEYTHRTATAVELPPAAVARVFQRARNEGASVVLVHTHPDGGALGSVLPSPRDLAGEATLVPALQRRVPRLPHARLILGPAATHAALFNATADNETDTALEDHSELDGPRQRLHPGVQALRVLEIGADIIVHDEATGALIAGASLSTRQRDSMFDRQVRAFGAAGQERLAELRVGVVGLGGTGSIVAQQLAHLGVGKVLLVDPDVVETTNLNRVVGATREDVGRPKVDVARDMIERVNPAARIEAMRADVRDAAVARRILDVDFFFCCTDSHGSRAVLTQLAYQYLVPGIDVGVAIHVADGKVSHVSGRVQMLAPGLACLLCAGVLDAELVRRDLLSDAARAADPYIVGAAVPQPAVISINSAASSLAVTMFLAAVTGVPVTARHQRLRFDVGKVSSVDTAAVPTCPWCASHGYFLRGDSWQAPGRGTSSTTMSSVDSTALLAPVAQVVT